MLIPARLHARCALALCAWALLIPLAFAAGDDVTTPPAPTPTPRCPEGQIHDRKAGKCVPVKSSALNDEDRYLAFGNWRTLKGTRRRHRCSTLCPIKAMTAC